MLYNGSDDYSHLFEGEVNADPEDFQEEESEMGEKKTFLEKVDDFVDEHPFLFLGGCIGGGWLIGLIFKKVYTAGCIAGWNNCTKYFDDLESVVRKNLLTKDLNS